MTAAKKKGRLALLRAEFVFNARMGAATIVGLGAGLALGVLLFGLTILALERDVGPEWLVRGLAYASIPAGLVFVGIPLSRWLVDLWCPDSVVPLARDYLEQEEVG